MATVTGKTSQKIDELLNATLASVILDSSGQLVLTTKGGTVINAGSVSNTIVSATINSAKRLILTTRQGTTIDAGSVGASPADTWPVGSIFMAVTPTNPASLLGGGTWVPWGQGRVAVSVDPTQLGFDAVEETGGQATVALNSGNLPPHQHTIAHSHTINHGHYSDSRFGTGNSSVAFARSDSSAILTAGVMINNFTGNSGGASTPNSGDGPGSSNPVNIVQPYITCFMWKRTA